MPTEKQTDANLTQHRFNKPDTDVLSDRDMDEGALGDMPYEDECSRFDAAQQVPQPSLREQLQAFADKLDDSHGRLFNEGEVYVDRNAALDLIDTLVGLSREGDTYSDDVLARRLAQHGDDRFADVKAAFAEFHTGTKGDKTANRTTYAAFSPPLYEQLETLAMDLIDGRSPMFRQDEVIVNLNEPLELIETLLKFCPEKVKQSEQASASGEPPICEQLLQFADELLESPNPALRVEDVILDRKDAVAFVKKLIALSQKDGVPSDETLIKRLSQGGTEAVSTTGVLYSMQKDAAEDGPASRLPLYKQLQNLSDRVFTGAHNPLNKSETAVTVSEVLPLLNTLIDFCGPVETKAAAPARPTQSAERLERTVTQATEETQKAAKQPMRAATETSAKETTASEQASVEEPKFSREAAAETLPDESNATSADKEKETGGDEFEEAEEALKMHQPSLYDRLRDLEEALQEGRAPLMKPDHVTIPRDDALELVQTLIGYCEEGGVSVDDALIDRLSSDDHQGDTDYMPLRRVKQRARVIIGDATVQAEHILADARTLAARLLQETEDKVKERYDEAEKEINVRLSSTNEVSAKRLNESRDELITSRQRAVDILNRYMDKAEEDYQGYWERAEKSLIVSLEKSDTAYAKVADTFERELKVIHEDIETIDDILEELKLNRPR